ncbi:hypothetical protein ACLI4Z_02310 [Natrialbaceae archaeon A-arb3/5]
MIEDGGTKYGSRQHSIQSRWILEDIFSKGSGGKFGYHSMKRRKYIALLTATATTGLAGCALDENTSDNTTSTSDTDNTDSSTERNGRGDGPIAVPEECPVTQNLDVSLPDEFTESTIKSFVGEYEEAYKAQYVEEEYKGELTSSPSTEIVEYREDNSEFLVKTETVWGGTIKEDVIIDANPHIEVPDDVDPIDVEELPEKSTLAIETAQESLHQEEEIRRRGSEQNYIVLTEPLKAAQSDSGEYYVTIESIPVSLDITYQEQFADDAAYLAWYYIDSAVVRRTEDGTIRLNDGADINPENGPIVECRSEKLTR